MPAIKRHLIAKSETYQALRAEAAALGERADCSVKAIAVACGVSYQEAHDRLARYGRKNGEGVTTGRILEVARSFGKNLTRVNEQEIIAQYPGVHINLRHITTHHPDRFAAVWKDGKTYLVFTRRHVLCIKDGVNHDHTRGRAVRVESLYEVTSIFKEEV